MDSLLFVHTQTCVQSPFKAILCCKVEEEDESEGSDGEEGAAEEQSGKMSMSRMTGLAKLPNVIEWLTHALGDATRSPSEPPPPPSAIHLLNCVHQWQAHGS